MKLPKKFKVSTLGMVCLASIVVIAFILYFCCLSALEGLPAESPPRLAEVLEITKNILLILISVFSASLISVPLIEVRGKNTLCTQMLVEDVLGTPQFLSALSQTQKDTLLQSLNLDLYGSDPVKETMYASIRKKMNAPQTAEYYFTSCEYSVRCSVQGNLIQKKILKRMSLQAYKQSTLSNFPLCVTSFPEVEGQEYLSISCLKVDGWECDVDNDIHSKKTAINDPLFIKNGYTAQMCHLYSHDLCLSPAKPTVIEVEYTTTVPKSDKTMICRISSPCQKFKFHFTMDGENKNQYRIALNAFGFIDDGTKAPNHHDDTPTATIELNDWIFPLDGVAVTILEKDPAPAALPEPSGTAAV